MPFDSPRPLHVMMTVNAAWNIWNFRQPLLRALLDAGHRVTVLAPPDDAVPQLEALGVRFRALEMSAKGLNPLEGSVRGRSLIALVK